MPSVCTALQALPDKFVSELNGRQLRDVKLRVEGGGARAWEVEVVVNEYGDMHLGRGWKEFVRANGIELGQLLVFCYDGADKLTVTVFDGSECGRHCQREEEDDDAGTFSCIFPCNRYHGTNSVCG